MGPPGNRGSWGPCVLAQTQKSLTKRIKKCGKNAGAKTQNANANCIGVNLALMGAVRTSHWNRGGLTTHGPLGSRGSWGPCVLAHTQKSL
ncbi:unnamed protein product [Staurois parvus]|uniref:Uncharacterized protein n=1 Tax=Staurois parvus TaxID=386267 RepID=A0ABN9AKY2_9NEOB|nr:unnamed protein product [Staurois parvus]